MFPLSQNKRKDYRRVTITQIGLGPVSHIEPATAEATLMMVRPIPAGGVRRAKSVESEPTVKGMLANGPRRCRG